jgi:phospholipid/cholesterol/gamma-HCH transport system ATP-binding protein
MSENTPAVRLEDVSKAFGGRPVLRDLSFEVECGEAFCLLGRSGTGKSVTLKLIIGLLKADTGRVFIEGNDIGAMSGADLSAVRKRVGFLFQNAALFDSISVAENLAFPLRRHTKKRPDEIESIVHEKLKQVELENDGDKMPADLSGGMRKRAGLARALVLDPPILLVDEPSSGLDRITAREIDELLSRLKNQEKRTLIIVTHDVTGARQFADRMAVLDKEKIVATDTPDRLEQSENQLVRELVTGAQR